MTVTTQTASSQAMLSRYPESHVFPHLNQHTWEELNSGISEGRLPSIMEMCSLGDWGLLSLGAHLPVTKTQ